MKFWWILAILALILVVWGMRERFETYADALKDVGQTAGYISLTPKCPEGSALNAEKTMCKFTDTTKADVVPTCSSDTLEFVGGVCKPKPGGGSSGTTRENTTGGSSGNAGASVGATGTTSGNTTEGSSGTGSTSGTGSGVTPATVRKSNVLGPNFTSYGAPVDGNGVDSSKDNQYPELLGGGDPVSRQRGAGGGFGFGIGSLTGVDLQGAMPTAGGLGATEDSRFFPSSRQPGDMELIPDPYRVSQQFSSASYSFKTEPSPFLTDFSAFFR